MLELFDLDTFSERTLYRVLETIGANREEIISDIQDNLFERYDFEHANINMDWTSLVLHEIKHHSENMGTVVITDPIKSRLP